MDKSIINDIMNNEQLDDNLKESLINDTFRHSMKCKILQKPINNEGSLIKEPTVDNILKHSMNNNFKKSLVNEKINQLSIDNILKEPTVDNKKMKIIETL